VPVVLEAMVQEHERAAGVWQAEWQALPAIFTHTAGAVAHVREALAGLEVDAGRMRANLELTGGRILSEALAMALAPQLGLVAGQLVARELARQAAATGTHLRLAAEGDARVRAVLTPEAIAAALDPETYLGSAEVFIERALAEFHAGRRRRHSWWMIAIPTHRARSRSTACA
jgi:3-carboxy-cis,cis-muconate cycloisomerase